MNAIKRIFSLPKGFQLKLTLEFGPAKPQIQEVVKVIEIPRRPFEEVQRGYRERYPDLIGL